MDRATVLSLLPGEKHANARWLYRCLVELHGGSYSGTLAALRDSAGYKPGPEGAPRTSLMVECLDRAGLIKVTYRREAGASRRVHITCPGVQLLNAVLY